MSENNIKNSVLIATLILAFLALLFLIKKRKNKTAFYLYAFILSTCLVILQVIAIDMGFTKKHPYLLLLYMPFQHISPALFTAYSLSYLNMFKTFKQYQKIFYAPFIIFFFIYTLLKINISTHFALISKNTAALIQYEWDENTALTFGIIIGFINLYFIQQYEKKLGKLPYNDVNKKTKWLKWINISLIALCIVWLIIIINNKINPFLSGNTPYYPLWSLYLLLYSVIFIFGSQYVEKINKEQTPIPVITNVVKNNSINRFGKVFNSIELEKIQESNYKVTGILSFFATSLFDKNKEDDVLWSIAENCISKLDLEDCVIYILNKKNNSLVQKAALGNKALPQRKILSPIQIKVGKGIVGSVAKTKTKELINNLSKDTRYIIDDCKRNSELAVPIIYKDTFYGVLDSEHSNKDFFTEKHVFLFELIAKLTATKLHNITKKIKITITDDNAYYHELEELMKSKKIYKRTDLSLTYTAELLNISSSYLSQLVNTINNYNFSDYVNSYRVNEAKKMLISTQYKQYTIVSIGLEAGFNSKSAFYSAFKKHTGKTPSEYKEKHRKMS